MEARYRTQYSQPYIGGRHRERVQTEKSGEPRGEICPSDETPASSIGRTYCVMAMPAPQRVRTDAEVSVQETEMTAEKEVPAPPKSKTAPKPGTKRTACRQAVRLIGGLLLTAAVISCPLWLTGEELLPVMKKLSAASASIHLPRGTVSASDIVTEDTAQPAQTTTSAAQTTTAPTTGTTAAENTEGFLPVSEKQLGGGTKVGNIHVKNSTGYSPDFESLMKKNADCRIKLNAGYQVLIVHTHTTEGYAQRTDGLYDPDYSPRTTDTTQNVVAVGDVLAQRLEQAGIRTLHATEVHDHPQYNGSYDRAKETISKYLEKYPSIEMVLDVHRDAITYDDGTKVKPTAEINGKKAAQVMIISGCDAGGKLYFPEWKSNLCMALQIQSSAQKLHPGLMRPLNFAPYRYNMHLTPNSLLLEFGTDANTLEEALYSAELMGDAIVQVLLGYDVAK